MERLKARLLAEESGAIFSSDRNKRYVLWRHFKTGQRFVNFIMLNPSEANEHENDPTITRCINFAKSWGYDGLIVTNLFAYCTPYPSNIRKYEKNLSALNKAYLLKASEICEQTVCAWGNHGHLFERSAKIRKLLKPYPLFCIAINQNGEPKHPLYLKKELKLKPFQ